MTAVTVDSACHSIRCRTETIYLPRCLTQLPDATRHRRRLRSQGFTLIELLVVIAVIGMLVAVLLPAVQAAREAGRRLQCRNHLKQIGLAFATHEKNFRFYPSGGWDWDTPPTYTGSNPAIGANQRAGWGFQILPYLEEQHIWESDAATAIGRPIAVFFCPTRRAPQTVTIPDQYNPPITGTVVKHALCDFAASNREDTGIVRRFDPVRDHHVRDGLSNTMMVAEKRLNLTRLGQPQEDDNEGYTAGWNSDTMRRTSEVPLPDHHGIGDGDDRFGSSHSHAFHTVFADGAVHSIGYDVDADQFRTIGEISDGQSVDHTSF